MILEGFEIENWSCIRRVAVEGLPANGVIVMHGPNGTGKSSIVAALRACLMDFTSNSGSKDLKRWFPKNSTEKPRVSVTFRANGTCWRITKRFGSKESQLESRTSSGGWKLEQSTAADAHEKVRALLGNKNSDAGLHQLLWLTQAKIDLPKAKDFDSDVQSQLRGVLGVLQTPLDDRFLNRVKERWSRWFSARNKPGEAPKLKKDCPLDKAHAELQKQRDELARVEAEFQDFERKAQQSTDLQLLSRDLQRQLVKKNELRDQLQQEFERSLKRLESHRLAAERVTSAEQGLTAALHSKKERDTLTEQIELAERSIETAKKEHSERVRELQAAERRLRELRTEIQQRSEVRRELQAKYNYIQSRQQHLLIVENSKVAQGNLQQAESIGRELDELKKQINDRLAPDEATIKKMEANRLAAERARANLEATAITITVIPNHNADPATVTLDGTERIKNDAREYLSRHRAEIDIPTWGRIEFRRGSDARSINEIEDELARLDPEFAECVGQFGIAAADSEALAQLRNLLAEKKAREPELARLQKQLKRVAPDGIDPLRGEVQRLANLLTTRNSEQADLVDSDLERVAEDVKNHLAVIDADVVKLEVEAAATEREIDGEASVRSSNKSPANLRDREKAAIEALTALKAATEAHRTRLDRMVTSEQVAKAIDDAEATLQNAQMELDGAKLSESEETIFERREAAIAACQAIERQLSDVDREFHQLEGALRLSEGMHQKRSGIASRVEELARQTERERLESQAYDHLYSLFEECREKQLSTVMGPIHDRVFRWMRLLRIGNYQSIHFNDHFLPEKLIAADGAVELPMDEESTGTIEQMALMVRLALGSTLSTVEEPAVAILDDPLTHSDVVRLNMMNAVIKNAAAGDSSTNPPAGPLQIIVTTCHPEWFAIDGAKVIDLSKSDVLSRAI